MRRRLLAVLAAAALVLGFSTAIAHHAQAATSATAAATGPIVGYEGLCLDDRAASTAPLNPVQVYT